jgi:O-antigen/teichoic acid export membrane protein
VIGVGAAVLLYLNRVVDSGFELGLGVREIAADPGFLPSVGPAVLGFRLALAAVVASVTALVGLTVLPSPDGPVLAAFGFTLVAVGFGTRWIHVALDRAPLVGVAQAAGQLIMVAMVVLLVRDTGDVLGVPAAQVVGDLAAAGILFAALWRSPARIRIRFDFAKVRPLLPRATHLVASALLGITIYNSDFLFLRVLRDARAVGFYAAAYTLVTFFLNVGATYNLSLLPSLTRLRGDPAARQRLYDSAMAHVFAVGLPIAVGGSLVAGGLVRLLYGPEFGPAALPLALLIWWIPLNLLRDVPLMAVLSEGGERIAFRITAQAAGLNVALNLLLIPGLGLLGAAIATLATETIRMALALRAAGRLGLTLPPFGRFGRALAAGSLLTAAVVLTPGDSIWIAVPLGAVAYAAGLVLTGGLKVRAGWRPELTV